MIFCGMKNHNKRWLMHVQQIIMPSFPSHSMHDATHSEAILHNNRNASGRRKCKVIVWLFGHEEAARNIEETDRNSVCNFK